MNKSSENNYYTAEDARRAVDKYYEGQREKYIDSDIIKSILEKIREQSQIGKVGLVLNDLGMGLSVDEMIIIGGVLEDLGYKTIAEMSDIIIISWRS